MGERARSGRAGEVFWALAARVPQHGTERRETTDRCPGQPMPKRRPAAAPTMIQWGAWGVGERRAFLTRIRRRLDFVAISPSTLSSPIIPDWERQTSLSLPPFPCLSPRSAKSYPGLLQRVCHRRPGDRRRLCLRHRVLLRVLLLLRAPAPPPRAGCRSLEGFALPSPSLPATTPPSLLLAHAVDSHVRGASHTSRRLTAKTETVLLSSRRLTTMGSLI